MLFRLSRLRLFPRSRRDFCFRSFCSRLTLTPLTSIFLIDRIAIWQSISSRQIAARIRRVNAVAVITGIGLVTPLGRSVDETWASLLAGRRITDHTRVEAKNADN